MARYRESLIIDPRKKILQTMGFLLSCGACGGKETLRLLLVERQ
jgi:hypothetical protein